MKKQTKIILIVSVCVIIVLAVIIGALFRRRQANNDIEQSQSYAYNPTVEQYTTEPSYSDAIAPVTSEDQSDITTKYEQTFVTEAVPDVNETNSALTYSTISIDNNLIEFPCNYSTIKEYFTLYTYNEIGEEIPFDEANYGTEFTVHTYPNTAETAGLISFTFVGDEGSTIENYKTKIVNITAISTNHAMMPIALRNGLHFGCTAEEIFDAYNYTYDVYKVYDDNSFFIEINIDGDTYQFYGAKRALTQFEFTFND